MIVFWYRSLFGMICAGFVAGMMAGCGDNGEPPMLGRTVGGVK